ncbi:hypothetical protein NC797_17320 [Aquibacillus sp. 3ASR75-11]|uniref:Uncharacterized protein n=1 Tax=Terrihalobacillus insolitus TaxID=2950438 RepID=A0A9X3WV06_9BACI|nr:hypothetical protein [Terrihalobacillus insolitus]MDC3413274.1 hypothetical protein [Terrihalobacillus insolitus]MDC3426257.1 hypothetical protein [Terrihalobacillus insolitus]
MDRNENFHRISGFFILIGAVGMVIATLYHPLLVDPFNGIRAFDGYTSSNNWTTDHIGMLLAVSLWLIGLMGYPSFIINPSVKSKTASILIGVSFALWMTILVAELTMIPIIGEKVMRVEVDETFIVWEAVFALGLLLGYVAMSVIWLAVAYFGWDLKKNNQGSTLFQYSAYIGGCLGFVGILITFFNYELAYFVLPLTNGIPFLWTMVLGWKMIRA